MIKYHSITHKTNSLAERESAINETLPCAGFPRVLLQTCDRVEIYWGEGDITAGVLRHLAMVVSGLESSLTGESAIQGQVKEAYRQACAQYKLSPALHKLFQTALNIGKKVRTLSAIGQGAVSHSQAVIECLTQNCIPLKKSVISILGVNKLNEDTIKYLRQKGANTIFLGNRHYEKASELAAKYDCQAFRLEEMTRMLANSDVLITATSAPHTIVKPHHIHPEKQMTIIDIAFPRDVDESIGTYPNIRLFNLEDINRLINNNLEVRKERINLALQIVDEEVNAFYENQKLKPTPNINAEFMANERLNIKSL